MTAMIVGRPKRTRPTDRVNYNMDKIVREMLRDIADRNGRNEGAQVEQLVIFYEAVEQLNVEGKSLSFDSINARVREIWADINARHDAASGDEQ